MQNESTIKIQKYLPLSYFKEINLQSAIVAVVKSVNAINKKLRHQIREIKASEKNSKKIRKYLKQNQLEEKEVIISQISQYINDIINIQIPFNPPQTKQEYQKWSQYWPINFVQQQIYKKIQHSKQEQSLIEEILLKKGQIILFVQNKLIYCYETQKSCCQGTIRHPIMQLLQVWPNTSTFDQLPSAYYLTKIRMFCKIPICGMCAMALVHSRLERIYTFERNLQERTAEILCNQRLNHKVKIFLVQGTSLV